MGRILKKKDPVKKREQRAEKANDSSPANGIDGASVSKPPAAIKKAPVPAPGKPKTAGGDGIVQKSIQFLREVKIELKKVTWPSRKQTMGSTVVVIILVMVISLFLGVVDFSLSSLIRAVLP